MDYLKTGCETPLIRRTQIKDIFPLTTRTECHPTQAENTMVGINGFNMLKAEEPPWISRDAPE